MHWNNLSAVTGEKIFDILCDKKCTLKVLDLSNNMIGKNILNNNQHNIGTDAFCRFLEQNQEIVHLDMSFNKFDYK